MKRIDRLNLVDRIGRELQSTMTYSDIKGYLAAFGVDISKETSDRGGSKWVYTKDLLASENDELVLKIADELEIEHDFSISAKIDASDSNYWQTNHFRLFISHLAEHKKKVTSLQNALVPYGISCFVAHEDIEPTQEWLDEIKKALFSMDALTAVLTEDFGKSKWADQEVGVAIGRDVLVIPIMKGIDPYGFIGKYQGLQGNGKKVSKVAQLLFGIITKHPKTKEKMASLLVNQVVLSNDVNVAVKKLELLRKIDALPVKHLEKVRDDSKQNTVLTESKKYIELLNDMLVERELQKFTPIKESPFDFDADIPF